MPKWGVKHLQDMHRDQNQGYLGAKVHTPFVEMLDFFFIFPLNQTVFQFISGWPLQLQINMFQGNSLFLELMHTELLIILPGAVFFELPIE